MCPCERVRESQTAAPCSTVEAQPARSPIPCRRLRGEQPDRTAATTAAAGRGRLQCGHQCNGQRRRSQCKNHRDCSMRPENMSSFSAIKLDIWEHKMGQIQGFEAITASFRPGPSAGKARGRRARSGPWNCQCRGLSGVPIERVSILLGHESVRTTGRNYAPWVRSRQEQLEADLTCAWSLDPVIAAQTSAARGTRRVHEKNQRSNSHILKR